jgi:hypothetical protein
MTVGRLLQETSSMELTMWQAFLVADDERREEQRRRALEDRALEER